MVLVSICLVGFPRYYYVVFAAGSAATVSSSDLALLRPHSSQQSTAFGNMSVTRTLVDAGDVMSKGEIDSPPESALCVFTDRKNACSCTDQYPCLLSAIQQGSLPVFDYLSYLTCENIWLGGKRVSPSHAKRTL